MEYDPHIPASHCLECGDEIAYGKRSDSKFCSDRCKNRYHNRAVSGMRHFREKTDRALEKNHRILDRLLKAGIGTADLSWLLSQGFQAEYVTSVIRGRTSLTISCYDIQYRMTGQKVFGIQRLQGFGEKRTNDYLCKK